MSQQAGRTHAERVSKSRVCTFTWQIMYNSRSDLVEWRIEQNQSIQPVDEFGTKYGTASATSDEMK